MESTRKGRTGALLSGVLVALLLSALVFWIWDELRTRYLLSRDFESLGRNAQGCGEYRHRKTGIVFVRLPGGEFYMGSPDPESDLGPVEGPLHKVTLSPFLLAKYEMTPAEWRRVMGNTPSYIPAGLLRLMGNTPSRFKGDSLPLEQVSWDDCERFCRETGLSLPTEAEWEYACRAGTKGPYAGTGKLDDLGWYSENSGGRLHAVGEKEPNDFGLYDMHGNVWEWCRDVYDRKFYAKPEATQKDPVYTSGSEYRVFRGGSWYSSAWYCRSAFRGGVRQLSSNDYVGFRPSASLP